MFLHAIYTLGIVWTVISGVSTQPLGVACPSGGTLWICTGNSVAYTVQRASSRKDVNGIIIMAQNDANDLSGQMALAVKPFVGANTEMPIQPKFLDTMVAADGFECTVEFSNMRSDGSLGGMQRLDTCYGAIVQDMIQCFVDWDNLLEWTVSVKATNQARIGVSMLCSETE